MIDNHAHLAYVTIPAMKRILPLALTALLLLASTLLASCQPQPTPTATTTAPTVTILDGEQTYALATLERVPANLLAEAGLTLGAKDRLLYLGASIPLDQPLPNAETYTLQIRRAVAVTILTPQGRQTLQTAAFTVGEALTEAGIHVSTGDRLEPSVETNIIDGLTITYQPGRALIVTVDGREVHIRSAAATVGQALADAGLPLIGLDYSLPFENEPLPADGRIRIVHVVEIVTLAQKALPFQSRFDPTADLEIDVSAVLQAGEAGLAVSRTRIRTEDGVEKSRLTETESIVRPPQDRIVGYGTHITPRTAVVDGVTIQYWRALLLYATSYSPCRSGVPQCLPGTASGTLVRKGEVAMTYPWYLAFAGEALYIPGYGHALVEDNNGSNSGAPAGNRYWIDLGYSDDDWVSWGGWVMVYFLMPVPADPVYILP